MPDAIAIPGLSVYKHTEPDCPVSSNICDIAIKHHSLSSLFIIENR